jgi:hypothetical protein
LNLVIFVHDKSSSGARMTLQETAVLASFCSAFKSRLATPSFIRPTPEGLVFTRPSPWLEGQGRDYRVSDEQAAQLAARIGSAQAVLSTIQAAAWIGIVVIMVVAMMKATEWYHPSLSLDYPVAALGVVMLFIVGVIPANAITYWVAGPMLAGVPGTSASPQPETRSTPFLILIVVFELFAFTTCAGYTCKSLAAGRLEWNAYLAAYLLWMCVQSAAALVRRLKGQRSAA